MFPLQTVLSALVLAVAVLTCTPVCNAEPAAEMCSAFMYPGSDDVDIKIAAIYGMHSSNETSCSELPRVATVQIAIAMQWATSLLNGDNSTGSFIPGVRLGVDIYDDCNQEYLAAQHAGAVVSQVIGSAVGQCSDDEQFSQGHEVPVAGIIGTTRSQTTTLVTKVVRASNLPVIGIAATLAELSDKTKYPGFFRATPNDHFQAKAIVDLALQFKWSYIVGISTNDNYGEMGMSHLQSLAADHRICVSVVKALDIFGEEDKKALSSFVRETLFAKVKMANGTLGVVYFGQNEGLVRLLSLIRDVRDDWLEASANLRKIHWMVSDGVALDADLINLLKPYGTRVVGVDMVTSAITSFRDFEQKFLMSPPSWAREGRWRLALETLAKEHFQCTSYNSSDDTGQAAKGCNLSGSNIYSGFLTTTVDAVYLIANTLKTMHSALCSGQKGVCYGLKERLGEGMLASYNLSPVDYTAMHQSHVPEEFLSTGRALVLDGADFLVRNQSLYVLKANEGDTFVEIGRYSVDSVELLPQAQGKQVDLLPSSECSNICEECHHLGAMNYEFVEGDYVILGIFSVHWKAVDEPFKCGAFRADSVSLPAMKSFTHAVQWLKTELDVNFGYLAVDDCYSPLTITRLLSKIMSGDLKVVSKNTHKVLDPKKIVACIGAQSSPVTIAVLPMLQNLNIPLISYSSTNPSLDNRITYPYFSRTVISDTQQASAISLILRQLNVTYVGAIVFGNTYGRALYQAFREKAEASGICVDDAFEVTEATTANDLKPLLARYRATQVFVIVAFIMDKLALTLTDAIEHRDTFVFVGSEAWSRLYEVIDGERGERVRGSLILEPIGFNVDYGFKNFMQSWSQSDAEKNDWLRKFWENYFHCNLPRGFNNVYQRSCHGNFSLIPLDKLEEAPLVVHASVATVAAGVAFKNLIGDVRRNPDDVLPLDPNALTEKIRDVTLTSRDGTAFKPFYPTGNGNNGFRIFNVQLIGTNLYRYEEVGTFRNEKLTTYPSKLRFYDITGQVVPSVVSSCQYRDKCDQICNSRQATVAPIKTTAKTEPIVENDDNDRPELVVIILAVVVGFLSIVIIVIILLAVLTCTGRIKWSKENHYYHESNNSVPSKSYNQSRESQSSASFTASAVSNRPPLPSRIRKNTVISYKADPSYSNKAFSDICPFQYGDTTQNSDTETSRSRSLSLGDPRVVGDNRKINSPHILQTTDYAASQISSASVASFSNQSDKSDRLNNSVNRLTASPSDSVQVLDDLQPERSLPQVQQAIALVHQPQQYHMYPSRSKPEFNMEKINPQPSYRMDRPINTGRNPRLPPEELTHQQKLIILQELQSPNLDDKIRQQYLALLYQIQRPNHTRLQPQASNLNQPYVDHQIPRAQPHVILSEPGRAVFFNNVTDANAIYTIQPATPSSVVSSKDPDYIYVLTADGMVNPLHYKDYTCMQKSGIIEKPYIGENVLQRLPNANSVNKNIGDTQSSDDFGAIDSGAHDIAKHPVYFISGGRSAEKYAQHVAQPSDSSGSVVYTHILNPRKEPPSHTYMAFEGNESDSKNSDRQTQQKFISSQDQRFHNKQPPPSPHSKTVAPEYLTPLPDSGLANAVGDFGPGIPGLVELPREAFLGENHPEDNFVQTPANGVSEVGVSVKAMPIVPINKNYAQINYPQTGAPTYTVASSDYSVNVTKSRMSSVPQNSAHPPLAYHPGEIPSSDKEYDPSHIQASTNSFDADGRKISSFKDDNDNNKGLYSQIPGNRLTKSELSSPSKNTLTASHEKEIPLPKEEGLNKEHKINPKNTTRNSGSLENDTAIHTNTGVAVPDQKNVQGLGMAFPQHPDILENLTESDQSITEV